MGVKSLAADKPKIVFHAAMLTVQNFGFFAMYFATWMATPEAEVCAESRFAEGYMAMSCFLVAFLCIGMGFGGYCDDTFLFTFYWICHAVPAVGGYSVCTLLIPLARFSETGIACATLSPVVGSVVQVVYIMHAGLYFCYVGNMVSVTYLSFVKPTFGFKFNYTICLGLVALAEAIVFGLMIKYGVFEPLPGPASPKKLFGMF